MTTKGDPGLSLRAAADALGISRKKLLRMIGDGLPVIRKSERVYVDLESARDWIALNETQATRTTLALHPDDPRYRLKRATALLDQTAMGLEYGVFVRREDARRRYESEIVAFRAALIQIPGMIDSVEAIPAAIEAALAELRMDDPATWTPITAPLPKINLPEPDPDADMDFAAMLPASDPRVAGLQMKVARAESALKELWLSITYRDDCIAIVRAHFDIFRERARAIPSYLELALQPGDNLPDMLADEIDNALAEWSGQTVEERPRVRAQASDEFEDVDGKGSGYLST
jgi:hypothetical protein